MGKMPDQKEHDFLQSKNRKLEYFSFLRLLRNGARVFPPLAWANNCRRLLYESQYLDFFTVPLVEQMEKWPPKIIIDTTNHCNASCVWCINPTMKNPKGVMEEKLFRNIVDEYAVRGGNIWLGTFGEPFLDKNIVERALYAVKKSKVLDVTLLTNGTIINEKQAKKLIHGGVNLEFSLDEIDAELFEKIKKVSFDKVWNNIITCLEINRKSRKQVTIGIRMKTMREEHEILAHPKYHILKELADKVDLTPISSSDSIGNWSGNFDKESFFKEYLKGRVQEGIYKSYNKINKAPCSQLWASMVVNWDGKVVLCCADITASETMGDLNHQSIAEIWKGKKYEKIRHFAVSRQRSSLRLCSKCDQHQGWRYLSNYYKLGRNFYTNFLFGNFYRKRRDKLIFRYNYIFNTLNSVTPSVLDLKKFKRAMVLAPHPDDEAIGCGGALANLTKMGCEVEAIFLTDGTSDMANKVGDVSEIRRKEARESCKTLGINHIHFLRNIDFQLRPNRENVNFILSRLKSFKPDLIFTPFFTDNHPDHAVTAILLALAAEEYDEDFFCCCYELWSTIIPNYLVDISPFLNNKIEAILSHKSQTTECDFVDMVKGLNRYRAVASGHPFQYSEAFFGTPKNTYKDIAKQFQKNLSIKDRIIYE